MTNSEMFAEAHAAARIDVEWTRANIAKVGVLHPHHYYFRLHLIGLQYEERAKRIGSRPMPASYWAEVSTDGRIER